MEHIDNAIYEDLTLATPHVHEKTEEYRYHPKTTGDSIAKAIVHFSARCADFLFKERYGERAIVLETIAAVPGMVGGLLQHLKSLRFITDDRGWIKTLLDEAENERMHLIVYSHIAKPTLFERILILIVQFFFYHLYLVLYLISPHVSHRVVGYFEEEAIHSYTRYLSLIQDGTIKNIEAPQIAKTYWNLPDNAMLIDVVKATIKDEMIHRDVNHQFANDKIGTSLWSA
jgi:ubiquinol oxidase